MRQLTYAMHFRGQASRSGENTAVLRVTSSGASCTMETHVRPTGLEASLRATEGELAFLESDIRLTGPESFEGQATLTFGDEGQHSLRLASMSAGHLVPSGAAGLLAGSVSWRVEGGEGQFASAKGFVTSTFTLDEAGDLSDYHCGLIFLPE